MFKLNLNLIKIRNYKIYFNSYRTLSSASDIVFVDSQTFSEEDTEQLASGCTVPVVTVSNAGLSPALCLAELMTLFEKYQYLRRLIISYIGVGSESTLNTYAVLLPKVGMHLRYLISDVRELTTCCFAIIVPILVLI
jgi:ornithine carbamoyltransferase